MSNLTILEQLIINYPNKNWNWEVLSENLNISLEFISNNLDKPWVWDCICDRIDITIEFMIIHYEYGENGWQWSMIYLNSGILINDIYIYIII